MVKTLFACTVAVMAMLSGAMTASAAQGRWCAVYANAEGAKNCYFATRQQCMQDLRGKGGYCAPNYTSR